MNAIDKALSQVREDIRRAGERLPDADFRTLLEEIAADMEAKIDALDEVEDDDE